MGGRVSAEYYRKYRATHPAYRERERQRLKNRKKSPRNRDYKKEYQQRLRRAGLREPTEGWLLESSLMRKAKEHALRVKKPDMRTWVYDDTYEELVCVCALALCEGKDPAPAMKAWMVERATRTRLGAPLHEARL